MAPSPLPEVHKGDQLLSVAAQGRAAAADRNRRLRASRDWYNKVRKDYQDE